jgi:hypothetical protein
MAADTRRPIRDVEAVRAFAFAGNARFTLVSERTATRFTYQLKRPREDGSRERFPFFVKVLTGPCNTEDYGFAGTVWSDARDRIAPSARAKIGGGAPSIVALRWFLSRLALGDISGVEFWHEGRCGRCGRTLTVPDSIERGIGPECAGRMTA